MWNKIKSPSSASTAQYVRETKDINSNEKVEYDIVIGGGTLGIFLACALQLQGLKVAVLERGPLKGRD